jgi:hypothetical protein
MKVARVRADPLPCPLVISLPKLPSELDAPRGMLMNCRAAQFDPGGKLLGESSGAASIVAGLLAAASALYRGDEAIPVAA